MGTPKKKSKKSSSSSSSSSLACLPDEIVLDCLVRVPRRDYENLSSVSKRLRSLVRSPELHRMRSRLDKDSVFVCIREREKLYTDSTYLWSTLRRTTTTTTTEYQLVPIPFPCRNFMYCSASVAVDTDIYFVGGNPKPTEVWILDTRSGKLRQGPMMQDPLFTVNKNAVGVADGKMYVFHELKNGSIKEEVLDMESQTWEDSADPGEKLRSRPMAESSVTLEGKVYALDWGTITVYDLRQGRRKEKLEMPIRNWAWSMSVADNLLFACFHRCGLMWLDTKLNIFRIVTGDVQTLQLDCCVSTMAEYYGKLAVFWRGRRKDITNKGVTNKDKKKEEKIWLALIALDRVGGEVRGTIEWSGIVATIPYLCQFLHCFVASE